MAFRVVVADDHEVVRRGLCELVANHPGWEVCGEARDGREAVAQVASVRPDAIILDIAMPNLNGLEAARQILKNDPKTKVLILTLHGSPQVIQDVVQRRRSGILLKSDAVRDLVRRSKRSRRERFTLLPRWHRRCSTDTCTRRVRR